MAPLGPETGRGHLTLTADEARLVCMALRQYAAEYATVQDAETLEAVAARIEGEAAG